MPDIGGFTKAKVSPLPYLAVIRRRPPSELHSPPVLPSQVTAVDSLLTNLQGGVITFAAPNEWPFGDSGDRCAPQFIGCHQRYCYCQQYCRRSLRGHSIVG